MHRIEEDKYFLISLMGKKRSRSETRCKKNFFKDRDCLIVNLSASKPLLPQCAGKLIPAVLEKEVTFYPKEEASAGSGLLSTSV